MAEQHPGDRAPVGHAPGAPDHAPGAMADHAPGAMADHAPSAGAAYAHGTMDIAEHQKTFEGFIRFWVVLFGASALVLIFLAIVAA